jgi:dihydrofolate reductase
MHPAAGIVRRDVAAAVGETDRLVSIAGAAVASAALEAGLVDELRIFRHPVVVGGGTPFLPPLPALVRFDLAETRTFETGVIFERYRRTAASSG